MQNNNAHPTLRLRLINPDPPAVMLGQKESDTSADTVLNADENIRPTVNIDMNNGRNTNKSILKQPNGISSHSQQILHARMMMS